MSLAVDPANPLIVTGAAEQPGVINQSQDGGDHWANIGIPNVTTYALQASPAGQNLLWAGTSNGIYRFKDGQWSQTGLTGQTVLSLAIYPGKNDLLFTGTTSGIQISRDGGSNWVQGPDELVGIPVQAIAFDPNDGELIYYCTPAHGVLRDHIEWSLLQP